MKFSLSRGVLAAALAFGCSPAIPPPVRYLSAGASPDEQTARANAANDDPNLKPPFGPFDVQTVFYIEKSNDKDRVDYGMRLDQYCAPVDGNAVFPYWRELQHAPPVRSHPISFLQHIAYGLSEQKVVERSRTGGKFMVQLKQVKRPILIVTGQDADAHCTATAYSLVKDLKNARLDYIFAKVAGSMGVDYLDVHGTDTKTGKVLVEHLTP